MDALQEVLTEDGARLQAGARAYNYYDMRPGVIGSVDHDGWFRFIHDDGSMSMLNGARICTVAYARRRGFRDA